MLLHLITPEGRENSIAQKLSKRLVKLEAEFSLQYDKADGLRYNKGFVLLNIRSTEKDRIFEVIKLSGIKGFREINESDLESKFYEAIDKAVEHTKIEPLKSYTVKKGAFAGLELLVEEVGSEAVKGKIELFGRQTPVSIEIDSL